MQIEHNAIYIFNANEIMSYNVRQITINVLHMAIVKTKDKNSKQLLINKLTLATKSNL